jgi:alanyl-tRNA synthetase
LDDPYTVSFRARVVACHRDDEGRVTAVLDKSYFYPDSGGQTADAGVIGSHRVSDVQEGDGESVCHVVDADPAEVERLTGKTVECRVDWRRRFDHMQQHTGQHVLSRAFVETAGLHTVSFHMGEETCTIDLEGSGFGADAAARAEELANNIVTENRPIIVRNVPVGELNDDEGVELRRSIPEGVMVARLVEVADFDVIPCCGTHVRTTGELGLIKVLKNEKAKGLQRVHFAVGERALRDYRDKHEIVQALGSRLTTSTADIGAKVEKLLAEGQQARKDFKRLSQALAGYEARQLLESADEWRGSKLVVHYFADRNDEYLRLISAALKGEPATVVVVGTGAGGVVCSASDDVTVDFAQSAVEAARAAGGSGGGKSGFAQLRLPEGADVKKFLEEVTDNVKRSIGQS